MPWTKDTIVEQLKALHEADHPLSYNKLARTHQSLVSAAAYHFGSYRAAVEAAGIDYAQITRRPRWTKQRIVGLIRAAGDAGEDLHWSAVTRRKDELGKAAFASLQPRLFGRWDAALTAAGLDAADISRYRRWGEPTILEELARRRQAGEPLNSGALQKADPGLHAAAVRYFGGFEDALRAAQIDPADHRRRRRWTKPQVLAGLRAAAEDRVRMSDGGVRAHDPALYGAAVRLFGSFTTARDAAGLDAPARKAAG